eukprot:SAG11_NODE_39222_length_238_cov_4.086331_1_plen_45_part_01
MKVLNLVDGTKGSLARPPFNFADPAYSNSKQGDPEVKAWLETGEE